MLPLKLRSLALALAFLLVVSSVVNAQFGRRPSRSSGMQTPSQSGDPFDSRFQVPEIPGRPNSPFDSYSGIPKWQKEAMDEAINSSHVWEQSGGSSSTASDMYASKRIPYVSDSDMIRSRERGRSAAFLIALLIKGIIGLVLLVVLLGVGIGATSYQKHRKSPYQPWQKDKPNGRHPFS